MIPEIYITLCRSDSQRTQNFLNIQKEIPGVNKFLALEATNDWEEIKLLFEHFQIPVRHYMYNRRFGGKLARWATFIMVMKYIYDVSLPGRIIVLEDDIRLSRDWDFSHEKWPKGTSFVKLSTWGEIAAAGYDGSVMFFKKLYEIGIDDNNDRWMLKNKIPEYNEDVLEKNNKRLRKSGKEEALICEPNKGVIWEGRGTGKKPSMEGCSFIIHSINGPMSDVKRLQIPNADGEVLRIPADDSKIFAEKIFKHKDDLDFKQVLSRLKDNEH